MPGTPGGQSHHSSCRDRPCRYRPPRPPHRPAPHAPPRRSATRCLCLRACRICCAPNRRCNRSCRPPKSRARTIKSPSVPLHHDMGWSRVLSSQSPSIATVADPNSRSRAGLLGVTREHLRITGTPLVLAVRPEKLWFARHKGALSEADINRISAVVLDVTLIGEMYRYLLETEFDALLTLAAASVRRLRTRSIRTGHRRMV